MEPAHDTAQVVSIAPVAPQATGKVMIQGQTIEVWQDHLLEPFALLLQSLDGLTSLAGPPDPNGPSEEACVRAVYQSLYHFFHTLLPSASHQAIDGLAYAVALLLVAETIEAGRVVVAMPVAAARAGSEKREARGVSEREEVKGEGAEARKAVHSDSSPGRTGP